MRTIVVASARRPPALARFLLSIPLVLAAFLLAGFVFGVVGFNPLGRALYASVLLVLLLWGFASVLFWLDRVRSPLLAAAGLPFDREALRDSALGILIGMGAVSVVVGIVEVGGRVRFAYTGFHPAALLLGLWTLVAAAMVEEVTFRGYPLHRLMEAVGAPAAIVVTSCLFGLAHLRNPHASVLGAVNTAEIGVLLALGYVRTRSLWVPWGIHFGWNLALGMGYGLVVSGYSDFSAAIVGSVQGPHWLTGGGYGIEASVTTSVVILAAIAVLLALVRPRPAPEVIVSSDQPPHITPDHISLGRIQ